MQSDVLIMGAGTAGLMAARELAKAGKKVTILEARDRIGGRIYPLPTEEWGYEAMGGGEFVHGEAPVSTKLLEEAGLTYIHPTEWWSVLDGEPRVNEFATIRYPELEEKLLSLEEDTSVKDFFEQYFSTPEHEKMRNQMYRRVESYDAAEPSRASAFALRDELTKEGEWTQRNLKEGYGQLLKFLESECAKLGVEILLKKEVVEIAMTENGVRVICSDSLIYQTAQALVTVPLPVIQNIRFTPPIPEKIKAASEIGFGPVIKVLLRFKSKWWAGALEQNFEKMFFMFSNEAVPTWWTQYPEPHLTLTGWLAGPKAQALSEHSDAEITSMALESLSNIFKVPLQTLQEELLQSKVMNWQKDPFARGAYSYATPESAQAIEELLKPVDNKLFFAGEGVYEGDSTGTVEAALASGLRGAQDILD